MSFPLPDASKTLPFSDQSGKVSSFVPGTFLVPEQGRPFNILASVNKRSGQLFKIAFLNGDEKSITASGLANMSLKTAGQIRLANLMRFYAFNQDFDLYVKSAIKEHGLPVDDRMNWAKWLESVFRSTVPQEERRDEAVHNMLIHTLFEIDILANFNPSRLSEDNQSLPLPQQVSVYLKNYFSYQKSKIVKWLDDTYGTSNELLVMDGPATPSEDGSTPVLEHGEEDEAQQIGVINKVDLEKFRSLFTKWMARPSIREKVRNRVLACMSVILDTPAMKPAQLIEKLANELGISEHSSKRIFHTEFPTFVQKFLQTPEGKQLNNSTVEPGKLVMSNMEEPMRSRRFATDTKYTQNPSTPPAASTTPQPTPQPAPPAPGAPSAKQGKCTKCGKVGLVEATGHCAACDSSKVGSRKKRAEELEHVETEKVKFEKPKDAKEVEHTTLTVDNERHLPSFEGDPEGPKIKVTAKYATLRRIAEEEPKELGHALKELTAAFTALAEASEALTENLDLHSASEDAPLKDKVASRKKFASALRRIASEEPEAVESAVQELYQSLDEIAEAVENLAANLDIDLGVEEDELENMEETGDSFDNEDDFKSEEDLVEFDEEIGNQASSMLDAFENEKAASGPQVVCKTASGGVWTKYAAIDEQALKALCPNCTVTKSTVYVLTESAEPIASYSQETGLVDVDNVPADDYFGEELEELQSHLTE